MYPYLNSRHSVSDRRAWVCKVKVKVKVSIFCGIVDVGMVEFYRMQFFQCGCNSIIYLQPIQRHPIAWGNSPNKRKWNYCLKFLRHELSEMISFANHQFPSNHFHPNKGISNSWKFYQTLQIEFPSNCYWKYRANEVLFDDGTARIGWSLSLCLVKTIVLNWRLLRMRSHLKSPSYSH